jgi:hypothetical protein
MRVYVPPGSRASGERSRDPSSLLLLLAGFGGALVTRVGGWVRCCAVLYIVFARATPRG